jgi:hypothetical protein
VLPDYSNQSVFVFHGDEGALAVRRFEVYPNGPLFGASFWNAHLIRTARSLRLMPRSASTLGFTKDSCGSVCSSTMGLGGQTSIYRWGRNLTRSACDSALRRRKRRGDMESLDPAVSSRRQPHGRGGVAKVQRA